MVVNEENLIWVNDAEQKITEKMEWVSEKSKDKIPYTTINGTHDDRSASSTEFSLDDGINWWTNGFWGGMLWQMYHKTRDERYAQIAQISEEKLKQCFTDFYGLHHDVGFMFLLTYIADYKLTGNAEGRRFGLHAANLLAGRFNPVGKFIRAWNGEPKEGADDNRGWAIIDSMLNIPILYWATEETKDPRFKHIAMMHADTLMENFVRKDGSVRHIVQFNPETGIMERDYGGQGYAQGSCWTRGQAWGLYGFMMSYIHTKEERYLDTAKQIAHYFIANIPEDGLIPVDFRQPKEPYWYDDTAAAIAACGLLTIAEAVGEMEQDIYYQPALKMLKALYEKHCDFSRESDCFLQKCTGAYHDKKHEFSIIYGDYYFMEAIFKLKSVSTYLW
ncbi:glycoside hydrolase family 88 protein [Lachnospiraceae bacterium OttesenSCG-928-D06]|nr:glycoside hydrolase family 88 protein [Lachnospiraceae bacterium OttesenSCG-928-D06]